MAARFVRDEEAAGSNPATPTQGIRGSFSARGAALVGVVRHWGVRTPRPGLPDLAVSLWRKVSVSLRRRVILVSEKRLHVI